MIQDFAAAVCASATGDTVEDVALQQRLSLYQVFLKLYEHHQGLLDEILALENSGSRTLGKSPPFYIQAIHSGDRACLFTNLSGSTQLFYQPQQVWTIGRDARQVGIAVQDKRLSRCHAALRYVVNQGFYLVDLGSSNGSFVNGEPVWQPRCLQDGDRIRLGSTAIAFFQGSARRTLATISPDLLSQIDQAIAAQPDCQNLQSLPRSASPDGTLHFLRARSPTA